MADEPKVLGQSAPSATTLTDLYTVPGGASAVASSLVICNRGSVNTTFRVSIAIAGAGDASAQYLYYDHIVPGNSTFILTIGITLEETDVVRVYAGTGNLSFNLFGVEVV